MRGGWDAAATLLARLRREGIPNQRARTETHGELVTRLRSLIALLPSAENTVIVSHFVTLNVLYRIFTDEGIPKPGLALHLDNGSVTRLDAVCAERGRYTVAYANLVPR